MPPILWENMKKTNFEARFCQKCYKDPLYHFKNLRENVWSLKTKMGRVERSRRGLQPKARPLSLLPKLIDAINIKFICLKKETKCVKGKEVPALRG